MFLSISLFFVCLSAFMYTDIQLSLTVPGVPSYDENIPEALPMIRGSARTRMELIRTGSIVLIALSGLGILCFAALSSPNSEQT